MPFFQPYIPPTPPGTTFEGKTVIITGGNSGIGFEGARQFLALKASRVIITSRDKARGDDAVAQLRRGIASGSNQVIEVFDLDLDDYQSTLRFCERVKKDVPYLDVLVCNAGVVLMKHQISKSGHERMMQVNCYSHFLITLELLPLLQATATHRQSPSNITFTGSQVQKFNTIAGRPLPENIIAHFDKKENFTKAMARYADVKLLVNAFVRPLAAVSTSSAGSSASKDLVIVNNYCPGMVWTGFDKNTPLYVRCLAKIVFAVRGRSAADAARQMIYAVAIAGRESHGLFMTSNRIMSPTPFLDDDNGKAFIDKLWTDVMAELVSLDPGLKRWA